MLNVFIKLTDKNIKKNIPIEKQKRVFFMRFKIFQKQRTVVKLIWPFSSKKKLLQKKRLDHKYKNLHETLLIYFFKTRSLVSFCYKIC